MALYLQILDGDQKDQQFRLLDGTRIGRSIGEILIKDPKVSSLHAQVEKDKKGQLYLVDRGSTNGLKINNQKVQRIALIPGVRFEIGKINFKIIQVDASEPKEDQDLGSWISTLKKEIVELTGLPVTPNEQIQPFVQLIKVEFVTGPNVGSTMLLGYGPRTFGSINLDIEIFDPSLAAKGFTLSPDKNEVKVIHHQNDILLNGQPLNEETILRDGDILSFGSTKIRFEFLNDEEF